jgi:2-isopropylmalate synthase
MDERVEVFDTTLRDGEQAAGTRLGPREKLEVARQLARLGVDIIEAGFPISSPDDFKSVALISEQIDGPVICGLSRAVEKDIEVCAEALTKAKRSRIHTGLGVSDIHILGKFQDEKYGSTLGKKKKTIIEMAVRAVKQAKTHTDDVEFYAEDAGRAEQSFLMEILEAAIDAGATVVNIPDTTGYAVPDHFGKLIHDIRTQVPNIDRATISVHCHDDLGMAVTNSLAGVRNGARQIEGTINGVGERAGNAAIEEIVMALRTRKDFYGIDTAVKAKEFYRTSRLVAEMLGMAVPMNKAVVGENAFRHSAGIHVDGFLKRRDTYEIMKPQDVGFPQSSVVLTARTGRHGLIHRLEEIGYSLSPEEVDQVYQRFLAVADKKREVFDEDLTAIVHDEIRPVPEVYQLAYLHTASGTGTIPTATVRLKIGDDVLQGAACGDGPVDATYKAIAELVKIEVKLVKYDISAVTAGREAMGEVLVNLEKNGTRVVGRGVSTDIIEASAKAYIDGLNRLKAI